MKTYDLVFGIGGACCCTQALRNAGLQYVSFPWDWVSESDIRTRIDQIRNDFADWVRKESLVRVENADYKAGVIYRNERTRVVLPHDFPPRGDFETDHPRVAARYRRRYERLSRLIGKSGRVLVVWVDVPACPQATDDDRRYVLETLHAKWPNAVFDLLSFANAEGCPVDSRLETVSGSVRTVTFDYRDYKEAETWIADNRLLGRWLKREYRVPDYRTREEIRAWRRLAREKEYGRYGASNFIAYLVTKLQYKVYVHFMHCLKRKGVI